MNEIASRNLLNPIDAIAVVIYFVAVLWIGLHFSRRQTDADNYFVARKKIPGWAVGISMFASILSVYTFIAFPGWAYDGNWQILLKEFQMLTMVFVCAAVIIPIYRNVIRMSVYEYLEQRCGIFFRLYFSFGTLIAGPVGNGILLYVLCLAVNSMTGWDLRWLIIIIGLITFVYTLYGGVEGVVWTEVLQGLVFIGSGLLAVCFLLLFAAPDGPGQIIETAWNAGKFDLFNWDPSLVRQTTWVMIIVGVFNALAKFTRDPALVQRYLMAPTAGQAVKATLISTVCCVITWTTFTLMGSLLWAYFHLNLAPLPGDIQQGDKVFPFFIASTMPHGLAGLVLAGLCASAMSGLSSGLNTAGAIFVSDFYLRFSPGTTPARQLWISKLAVAVYGLISIATALAVTYWKGGIMQLTLDLMAQVSALVMGGATGIFFLGLLTRRANRRGMYAGLICGFLFSCWGILTSNKAIAGWMTEHVSFWPHVPHYPLHIWLLGVCTDLIVIVTGYLASILFNHHYRAPIHLTVWGGLRSKKSPPAQETPARVGGGLPPEHRGGGTKLT